MIPLLEKWRLPSFEHADLDSAEALSIHREVISQKPFLKNVYFDFYAEFVREARALQALPGALIELGSGGGFLKSMLPDVVTSDVCAAPFIDRIIFADKLPFPDGGVKGIFFLNVLHHLPDPEAFFKEADRALVNGGRVVMIEPFNSAWARVFYKRFHYEPFDEAAAQWRLPEGGRLTASNQAMPWIIFHRDRAQFESRFPRLKIKRLSPHGVLAYALSGGVTYRGFCPSGAYPLVRRIDRWLSHWPSVFPIFETIVLEKQ